MPRLRAFVHFALDYQHPLYVGGDDFGRSFRVPHESALSAVIVLPDRVGHFVLDGHDVLPEESPFSIPPEEGDDSRNAPVTSLQVALEFECPPAESHNDYYELAEAKAADAFISFRSWVRAVGGQFWLTPGADRPEMKDRTRLYDLDTGTAILPKSAHSIYLTVRLHPSVTIRLSEIADAFSRGEHPPVPETVLADARSIQFSAGPDTDRQRAVLSAAIAAEIKVKETLVARATDELKPLVDVIIDNPREVTLSIPQLLGKTCNAVTGKSLAKDRNGLYQAVEQLFKVCNNVAHRSLIPSEEETRAAVNAAVDLFTWIDQLSADTGS